MEECSVLIETTKSAEDKTSRWFDLSIDYELFRDQLGVEVFYKNQHSPLDIANNKCYITARTKEGKQKGTKRQRSKMPKVPGSFQTSPVPEDNK